MFCGAKIIKIFFIGKNAFIFLTNEKIYVILQQYSYIIQQPIKIVLFMKKFMKETIADPVAEAQRYVQNAKELLEGKLTLPASTFLAVLASFLVEDENLSDFFASAFVTNFA